MVRSLYLFFVWSEMELNSIFVRRDYLKDKVLKAENVCFYWKYCENCEKVYGIMNELKKKGFDSF